MEIKTCLLYFLEREVLYMKPKHGKRLMKIRYPHEQNLVDRLKTCLDMCCIPHIIFDDVNYFTIYIDRGKCTWNQVMHEVNRVHAVKFGYENGLEIKDGKLYNYVN